MSQAELSNAVEFIPGRLYFVALRACPQSSREGTSIPYREIPPCPRLSPLFRPPPPPPPPSACADGPRARASCSLLLPLAPRRPSPSQPTTSPSTTTSSTSRSWPTLGRSTSPVSGSLSTSSTASWPTPTSTSTARDGRDGALPIVPVDAAPLLTPTNLAPFPLVLASSPPLVFSPPPPCFSPSAVPTSASTTFAATTHISARMRRFSWPATRWSAAG